MGPESQLSSEPRRRTCEAREAPSILDEVEVEMVPVAKVRPEEGLGRQRDQDGHRALRRSIEQFGVLTPITVRRATDGSDDLLLIKGQGRTLACVLLGIETIPAIVVREASTEVDKVQHFLVENVARLKMRPIDRALLIAKARKAGEETASVAARFGVSAATVRRLESQLESASKREIGVLRRSGASLSLHAMVSKNVEDFERSDVFEAVTAAGVSAGDLSVVLKAIGWRNLTALGKPYRQQRLALLAWACRKLKTLPRDMSSRDKIVELARAFPRTLTEDGGRTAVGE